MMQLFLNSMILMLSFIFTQMMHPLSMGLILLIQTFIICLMMGLMMKTFWFSYILFLIFLGGMLILFMYVTSLTSNEMFSMSKNLIFIFMLIFMYLLIILYIKDYMNTSMINNNETINMKNLSNLIYNTNYNNLIKLYNFPMNFLTIMLIFYLFLTLIVAVKITNFFYGPLRPMFN
nr:NADH dehydrogenase subunit 6 [Manota sp. WQY001]